jgi:hypothetical protein
MSNLDEYSSMRDMTCIHLDRTCIDYSAAVPQFSNTKMGRIWLQSGGAVIVETENEEEEARLLCHIRDARLWPQLQGTVQGLGVSESATRGCVTRNAQA